MYSRSFEWLVLAFILRGLKKFGEPTRKALIMEPSGSCFSAVMSEPKAPKEALVDPLETSGKRYERKARTHQSLKKESHDPQSSLN
jgi:hypothetical protein